MYVLFRIRLDGLAFYRRYGWIRKLVGLAFQFLQRGWLLLGLMTGDTGITFLLKNQGDIYIYKTNKFSFSLDCQMQWDTEKILSKENFRQSSFFWWFGMMPSVQSNFKFFAFMIASLYI